ncbi:hypothetical protein L1887_20866 [Cichorium endivia]|nr:hypothetical protein L1887_20866 [Cichorium endivia]
MKNTHPILLSLQCPNIQTRSIRIRRSERDMSILIPGFSLRLQVLLLVVWRCAGSDSGGGTRRKYTALTESFFISNNRVVTLNCSATAGGGGRFFKDNGIHHDMGGVLQLEKHRMYETPTKNVQELALKCKWEKS